MRFIPWMIFLFILASCGDVAELQNVRNQLDLTLSTLPQSADFTLLETEYENFSSDPSGCFYARTYRLIGTAIDADHALASYLSLFTAAGWTSRDKIPGGPAINISWEVIRSSTEETSVFMTETTYMQSLFDYQKAYQHYPTVFVASTTYILPQRDGC